MPASDYQKSLDAQYEDDLRESQRQQAQQEKLAQQAEKEQQAATKEQQRVANDAREAEFRAQKRPHYVDAHNNIQPTHSDEDWQQQQETARTNAAAHDEAATSGRKFTTSKLTGAPIYLESEAQLEAKRAAAAEVVRKKALDDQINANRAEYQKQAAGAPKLLTDKQKKALAQEHQAARFGIAGALDEQTKAVTGGNDWIPWNESPSPEALKAKERQKQLSAPDTQLSEDDLTEFDANDATKPLAAKIRGIQEALANDAAARQAYIDHARSRADLMLRRDAPDKWAALQRQKIAGMDPAALKSHLESSDADIEKQTAALESAYAPIQQQRAMHQQQLEQLQQENQQRQQQGFTAGEVVSYPGPDGQIEHWAKDLAVKRETLLAQAQSAEQEHAPLIEQLRVQQAKLQQDLDLRSEAAQAANAKQEEQKQAQEQQKKAAYQRLKFTPGFEQASTELEKLDAEHADRAAVLDMEPGDFPEEARAALDEDIQKRKAAVIESASQRATAAAETYAEIQQQTQQQSPDGGVYVASLKKRAAANSAGIKKLAAEQGISEEEAARLLQDAESHNWATFQQHHQEVADGSDSDKRQTRILSTGGILVNPAISDPDAYKAAVEASAGTPEAKAEAIARYPEVREQQGRQVLEAIDSVTKVLGESSLNDWKNWSDWKKQKPKDVSEAEWALRWTEHNKAQNTGVIGTMASKAKQFIRSIGAGLNDIGQQGAGLGAALYHATGMEAGSKGMMQLAQQFSRQADAHQTVLNLGGHTSDNFVGRGVFNQLPRLLPSIIPVGIATKGTQALIRGFAGTRLGARFLPSLAAGLSASATPAQALKTVETLRRTALGVAAGAGAAQTYSSQLVDIYTTLRQEHPELSHESAMRQAQAPAVVSGLATALLTVGFGSSGITRLLTRPAEADKLARKVFASQMHKLGFVASEFFKGGMKETLEESIDEGISQMAAAVGKGHNVQEAVAAFIKQLPELAVATMLLGGAGEAGPAMQESQVSKPVPQHLLPETLASANAAIENYASNADPEHQEGIKNRAQLALHIAQGGDLQDITQNERMLNDAGWTARDSKGVQLPEGKIERLKDYKGPAVFNVDASGRATIDPSYRQKLQTELPSVYHAIPESATQSTPALAAGPTTTPAGQTPASGSGSNANPSPVQTPAQSGAQPPSGGTAPAQSGTPVNSDAAASPSEALASRAPARQTATGSPQGGDGNRLVNDGSTAVPDTQQSIANFLQERGMPAAEAQSASVAIAQHPAMAGQDYDYFHKEPILRAQLLSDLGITGSQNSKESTTNPLRYQEGVLAKSPPAAGNASNSSSSSVPLMVTRAMRQQLYDLGHSKADVDAMKPSEAQRLISEKTTVNNRQQPDQPSVALAKDGSTAQPSTSPALPPSVQAALDDSIPGTPSQEVFTAIKKAVQAKELTEQQATTLVAQQSGALDHTELRQSLENKLGWNPTRANTAAALHFGDKTQSSIPLAAAEKQGGMDASPPSGPSGAANTQPSPTAPVPSSLSKNGSWARAKLATLAKIKDQAKKAWARQFFATLEEGFEKHHALYDAIGVGNAAKSWLDGKMTAVRDIGGKVTRLFDFSAMLAQFDYLADPRAAALATGIEEDIHAATVRLGIQQPGKYGYEALIKQWDELPDELRKVVWDSYYATQHTQENPHPLPSKLSEGRRYHLMHEFLRMLVQDQHFQGRITESTGTSPGLITWVQNLLRDLGSLLRGFVQSLSGTQRRQIESMVGEIAASLKSIEQASAKTTARLESLASLRDPAAVARQTLLKEGLLNPSALSNVFDALPQALKSRTLAQWKKDQPASTPAKATKSDLMRHLLGGMMGSAAEQQAIYQLLLPSKPGTSLLRQLLGKLKNLTSGNSAPGASQRENTPANALRALHVEALRALGGMEGLRFVQNLPGAVQDIFTAAPPARLEAMLTALREHELQQRAAGLPMFQGAIPSKLLSDLRNIAYQRGEDQAAADPSQAASDNSSPKARHKLRQHFLALERQAAYDRGEASTLTNQPPSTTVSDPQPPQLPDRAQDMLAALEENDREHQEASSPAAAAKLRTSLRLLEVAKTRARFFLRDKAARELHAAEQAGRQDLPKAQSLLALALGHIGSRRAASGWRTLGIPERRQLALLGIGVDQHPHTETGGYPYSLSRIESAELRLEFSIAGTPENQMAQEELTWMRQQPAEYQTALDPLSPAYVERDHVIIKQSALDDLSLAYPHTAALIRPELEARQSYGLRTDARLPSPKSEPTAGDPPRPPTPTPPRSEDPATPQQLELPPQSSTPASGSGIPLPKNSGTVSPTPPSLSFPIPLSKRGQVRRSTFPDAESLAAFQFKLDADTIANRRSTSTEVSKAEQRGLSLLARLMQDSPLGRAELEQKLLDYHRTLVQQAEAASAFGTFTPPPFHAFATEGSAGTPARAGNLPPPVGGDIISGLQSQGIRRLGPPDASDGWSWYRALQQDASLSKLKNAEAQRLARAGDITDPKARLFWLNENVVSLTSGRSIDEAATELSESADQQFPVGTGDELGQAILDALDARIAAAQNPSASDHEASSIQQLASSNESFATYAAGTPGQPFTAAELAKELQPEDEIQIGSEYLSVLEADSSSGSITLDSSRFGPVTLTGPQILHLTSGPNHLRIARNAQSETLRSSTQESEPSAARQTATGSPQGEDGNRLVNNGNSSPQSTAAQEAVRNAHSPSYKPDLLKPSPIESTLRDGPLPTVTPQDTAALDRDYHSAVTAGEALDQSTPDLDLEDDIADSADAYLDGELLPAAQRNPFYSALARAIESKMPARSTPATVVGILKNAGIKTEELKWTGIIPWLQQQAQNGPITQQQVLDYLANEGAVHLQEVLLGGSQTQLEDANLAVITQAKAEGMTQSGAEDYALFAARRAPHPLALPRPGATLSPDEALRSPSHILASLYADSAPHPGADVRPDRKQRGEPRPSVGGGPADTSRVLDWARKHRRFFSPRALQLKNFPGGEIFAGGEHVVYAHQFNSRLYKFTKPGFFGAQALDGPAYIERLALSNHVWQDDFKFEGFTRFPGDQDWRAITSQPFYAAANPAKPDSSMADILALLKDRGFIPFEAYHVHPDLGLQLWDIQTPGNVIATANGPMPVDLQLEPADPSRLKRLRAQIQQGPITPLFAAPRITEPPFDTPSQKALEESRIHAIDELLHGKRRPIAETPPPHQARSSRAQLHALLAHLRRSQRPSGSSAGNEQARLAEARRHDKALLINWARNAGVLLSELPSRYQLNSLDDKGGREHHVFFDPSNRWVKITKGDGSAFGYQPLDEGKNDEWMISQDPADVASYLEKLALQNQVFHDDIVLHGVLADPLGKVALIISQPDYQGTYAGTATAIQPAMEDAGFLRVEPPSARLEDPSAYYRPADNLAVVDMHDQNAVLQHNGTFLRVFDNIMLHPTGALRATFERLAAKHQTLPAAQRSQGEGLAKSLPASGSGSGIILPPNILPASARVEAAAAQTDPHPTPAQKEAGNYPKGKVTLHGLRLSIENPRGSTRSGTDATGKPWSVTMPHHYGYFLGTEGKDGDHVDFFLGPNPDSQQVLIINQRKVNTARISPSASVASTLRSSTQESEGRAVSGRFDEHKIMLGFDSPIAAARAYLASYTPGWRGFGSAVPTTIPVLKEWLENHDTTKIATRESIAKIAQTLPLKNPEIPANSVNPVQNLDSGILPAASRLQRTLDKAQSLDRRLATLPGASTTAKALDKSVTGIGQAANLIPTAVGKVIQSVTGIGQHIPGNAAMAQLGTTLGRADAAAAAKVGTTVANALQRVSGKDIRKAPDAVAAWLGKPDGLGSWTKSVVVDQLLPTALMPREWLALSHEMQRKTAFGAEKSNDLVRALSGNPRLSDLAYPTEFAQNPAYREQLFDAMENKIPMSSLPPAMQALAQRLRAMLRETGLELVRQGLMHPDTFEELQSNGWMPRYMLEEAQESAGSLLAAFKLGIQDLRQQRSTAYHIVDTTRRGKDGQYLTVNRQEGGRNAWRFRDAASRDAFYSDFIRQQALEMLQDRHGNTKDLQSMMSTLDGQQRREIRTQIQLLTRADMDAPAKLSQALAGMVKQAIEMQKARYKKEAPFDPPKLIKDPVYAVSRYILAQTHNAATMELLSETAKNKEWTSNVSLQGFTPIPDQTRFGPLAGKFVQKDIAQQILDKLDVPNAALRFYDAILRKWKSGKLVWNPGSHIRDAVGNAVFAYLGGSSIANPGNWPYYRQAMDIMRNGGPLYAELLEHGVLGGDAYSSLVRERLKGLLPDTKTVENFNPGLLQRFWFDFGSKFSATHEQLAEYRRMPDDFYKIAAYLKAKATFASDPNFKLQTLNLEQAAAQHVRKWFPYYDRLGGSGFMRIAGRAVNPFLSFFRESTRILATAAAERPIALSAALAFPAAISAISAMLLHLDDRDRDEISKDLAGRGKGILGLSDLHLFSMLLPFRSSQGTVQQWDISSIMPFADLLGQKVVPLEEKENAWQTFWRQTAAAGPVGGLVVAWINNRDLFSGRHLTEADMSTPEMLRAYTQHAAGVALPPLAPDLAATVGIGDGGALTKAGQRQVNKTLQTYDPVQTVIRSVFGMNVKSAAPNIYRQAEDFRKAHGYDAQPGFDYGTTITSRAKRLLVQELAQDAPNPRRITALATRLKALGVPLETSGDIAKVLKIIDPSQIMNGSKKSGLSAEQARQQFRQSLPPESRTLYEASLSEFERIKQKAPTLLRQ